MKNSWLHHQAEQRSSFYTILEKDYNIQPKRAVLEIDGIIAQNQHADLLKCNIGDPLFSINKISYDFRR